MQGVLSVILRVADRASHVSGDEARVTSVEYALLVVFIMLVILVGATLFGSIGLLLQFGLGLIVAGLILLGNEAALADRRS